MAEEFDPYYTWLSIPPDEQPPTLYRLLGLRRFEDNPDVIENAADRQMAHLRTFQSGKHSEDSQKLLNQVASAKINLLKPDKKAKYDKLLQEQIDLESSDSVLDEKSSARQEELSMTLVGFLEAIEAEKEKERQAKAEGKTGEPDDFDPYQAWLAVAPEDRPPTLYRLLGLRALEDNRKVIKTVAAKRTAQLRKHLSGEHAADAQRLLRQVTRARATLLDRNKKAEYDKLLRERMALEDKGSVLDAESSQRHEDLSTTLMGFLEAVEVEKLKRGAGETVGEKAKPAEPGRVARAVGRGRRVHDHHDRCPAGVRQIYRAGRQGDAG